MLPPGTARLTPPGGMPHASPVNKIVSEGRKVPQSSTTVLGSRSRNSSKDAVSSGRTGWTRRDAMDDRPWLGRTPRDPIRGVGRVPFAS
jgi:hypothetical protein